MPGTAYPLRQRDPLTPGGFEGYLTRHRCVERIGHRLATIGPTGGVIG